MGAMLVDEWGWEVRGRTAILASIAAGAKVEVGDMQILPFWEAGKITISTGGWAGSVCSLSRSHHDRYVYTSHICMYMSITIALMS